ncbi:AAA family ATPase [Bradyrhizobium diazoefficiens]|uniref:AAA family ATPase n=1 Tax=Bradyrhizobium diazoefficiens TaxID=1355477 RepID=UPI002714695C|nr:AAA family ATPase [Bradyrhizobium diazoefficiens]WLC19335.1 AAA family ATPase [Bradyrhizobium diazoefficiens]
MDDFYNSTADVSTRNNSVDQEGLARIGPYVICRNGRTGPASGQRRPVPRDEIAIAKDFLSRCRRTRWARDPASPSATILRDLVTEWVLDCNRYTDGVSVGAIIVAALELGIPCAPLGERDALIGVNFHSACVGTLLPIYPGKTQDDAWQKYAEENFLETDIKFMDAITPPPPRAWAVPDRILKRQVTLLYGDGAIGKSLLTLQLACSTVLSRGWLGCQPEAGPVIYIGAEDDEDELQNRLHDIAAHYNEPFSELIENGLYASSYAGQDMTLARFDSDGYIEPTPLFRALWGRAQIVRPVMIILDTLSDIFDGDENNRGQVAAFVALLRSLAIAANCAVIVNAHPSQSGSSSGTSGSTAWHGKVRGRLHLRAANKDEGDPDLRVLEYKKVQYGPLPPKLMLRYQNGVFVPEAPGGSTDPQIVEQRAEQVFLDLLDRFTRQGRNVTDKKGTTYAPACFAKEREATSEKLNKVVLAEAMLRLFDAGKIRVVTEGPRSKQRSRIVRT